MEASFAAQIAQKFVSPKPNIIVAISKKAAKTVVMSYRNTKIPIVFASVTCLLDKILKYPSALLFSVQLPQKIKKYIKHQKKKRRTWG